MRVSVGQVYIEPGVKFPFSYKMQVWLSQKLSDAAMDCSGFEKKYGAGFSLMVRLSAKAQLMDNSIAGPTVFKRDKDVEFTLFLPFDVIAEARDGCRSAVEHLLDGIQLIFREAGIDPGMLDKHRPSIIEHICSEPEMLTSAWPSRPAFPKR